jgi:hypothetical protein
VSHNISGVWELGEGLEQGVPRGLELAIEKLKVGHKISEIEGDVRRA